jgi:hypothetical protein
MFFLDQTLETGPSLGYNLATVPQYPFSVSELVDIKAEATFPSLPGKWLF